MKFATVWLKGFLILLFFAACVFITHIINPNTDSLGEFVSAYILGKGLLGYVLFVLLAGVLTALALPRQLLSFAGGYCFGMALGALLASFGSLTGCIMAFYYARFLGRKSIERRFGKRTEKLNKLIAEAPFTMSVFLRFLPLGNNLLTSLLAGVSRIAALPFFAGSFVGYLPQNIIFALLGSGIRVDPFWRGIISILLFLISTLLGLRLYHKLKKLV